MLRAIIANQASADLMDFLYNERATQNKINRSESPTLSSPSTKHRVAANSEKLHFVKIGSHVLRNQLLEAGCIQSNQTKFIKCSQEVLDHELEQYHPVR